MKIFSIENFSESETDVITLFSCIEKIMLINTWCNIYDSWFHSYNIVLKKIIIIAYLYNRDSL